MALGSGFKRFFRLSNVGKEVDEELAFHIEMKTEELVASGMTREAARAEAVERLGDIAWVREECRSIGKELRRREGAHELFDTLLQDVRYALRRIARQPGFAVLAVLILALGVGANTAMFSAYNDWTFRAQPMIENPDELVALYRQRIQPRRLDPRRGFSHLGFLAYKERAESFSALTARRSARVSMSDPGPTVEVRTRLVSTNYFDVLGVRMGLGRPFRPDEGETEGTHPVAVVSHELWRERLGANPDLAGLTVRLHRTDFQVIGVAPEGYRGLDVWDDVDVWVPLAMERALNVMFPVWNSDFFDDILVVIGRLGPNVDRSQAQAELDVLSAQVERPDTETGVQRRVVLDRRVRAQAIANFPAMARLMPIAGFSLVLLLITCVNVSALVLVRTLERKREIGFRLALGAGRKRIVRQLLTESTILAVPASLLSLGAAWIIARLVGNYVGPQLDMSLDHRVMAFAVLLAVVASLLLGLAPALYATRFAPTTGELEGPTHSGRRPRLLTWLVVGQLGATLVLLTGAGSFVRTLQRAGSAELGFESRDLLLFRPDLRQVEFSPAEAQRFYEETTARIGQLPGVVSVALAGTVPRFDNGILRWSSNELTRQGSDATSPMPVEYNVIGDGYFETLGSEIQTGRDFTLDDDASSPRVAIVNETLARGLWGASPRLGEVVRVGDERTSSMVEIVGIVEDARTFMLHDRAPPEIFLPLPQSPRMNLEVLVRAVPGATGLASAVRTEVSSVDGRLPPIRVESMESRIEQGLSGQRMWADLSSAFSLLSLLLATVGLYATLAFGVSQRTKEFGIRLALGARRLAVLRLVLGQGMRTTGLGIGIGLAGSVWLMRVLTTYVYANVGAELSRPDPRVIALCVAVLCIAALAACWRPARRATAADPMTTLRYE